MGEGGLGGRFFCGDVDEAFPKRETAGISYYITKLNLTNLTKLRQNYLPVAVVIDTSLAS